MIKSGISHEEAKTMAKEKAHVIAQESWSLPAAIHTDLVPGLKAMSRMNPQDSKMSKSKPEAGILIHDSPEEIMKKLAHAYCPPPGEFDNSEIRAEDTDNGITDEKTGNPVLAIAKLLLFKEGNPITYTRPVKFGGETIEFKSYEELEMAYNNGLHPNDLKAVVGIGISNLLATSRAYFEKII